MEEVRGQIILKIYVPPEMSGLDTEADGNVKAGSWMLELSAQRHPIVDLLRQDQRRVHLNHWTSPENHG